MSSLLTTVADMEHVAKSAMNCLHLTPAFPFRFISVGDERLVNIDAAINNRGSVML